MSIKKLIRCWHYHMRCLSWGYSSHYSVKLTRKNVRNRPFSGLRSSLLCLYSESVLKFSVDLTKVLYFLWRPRYPGQNAKIVQVSQRPQFSHASFFSSSLSVQAVQGCGTVVYGRKENLSFRILRLILLGIS